MKLLQSHQSATYLCIPHDKSITAQASLMVVCKTNAHMQCIAGEELSCKASHSSTHCSY